MGAPLKYFISKRVFCCQNTRKAVLLRRKVRRSAYVLPHQFSTSACPGEESAPAEQSDDKAQAKEGGDSFQTGEMGRNLKIIERMVVQNAEVWRGIPFAVFAVSMVSCFIAFFVILQDEIYMDFRYWEDISDR